VRAGALVANEAADRIGAVDGLILWQPVLMGQRFLQPFLRLKAAGEMLSHASSKGNATSVLRDKLGSGETIEIAGYSVSPRWHSGSTLQSSGRPSAQRVWHGSKWLLPRRPRR
jgi:hypothetical protein